MTTCALSTQTLTDNPTQEFDSIADEAFLSSSSQYMQDFSGFDYEKLDGLLQGGEIVLSDLFDAALGVGNSDSTACHSSGRFVY
jgi:hypothetical protein